MKNKTVILVLVFLSINFSCKDKISTEKKAIVLENDVSNLECFDKKEKEIIFERIFASKDLRTYLNPLNERSLPIEILTNKFVTKDLKIAQNGQTVILRDSLNKTDQTFEFSFSTINCEKQILEFAVWYEFEHADISGRINKLNNEWIIEITGHGIVD